MALSSSESALLTQTCENMNVAANTCREVLEMLRNLGNTGVVDIADHNNASTAHAAATNLAKIEDGNLVLGSKGYSPSLPDSYPIEMNPTNCGFYRTSQSMLSGTTKKFLDSNTIKMVDSNGDLLSISDANEQNSFEVYRFVVYSTYYDATVNATITLENKSTLEGDTAKTNHFLFGLSNSSGTWGHRYDMSASYFTPASNGSASLGKSGKAFDTAYFVTAPTTTSDARDKTDIEALGSEAVEFVKALNPVQFKMKEGRADIVSSDEDGRNAVFEASPGVRTHWGFAAQEVQEALVSAGCDPSDCAVWSLADKNDPDSRQALRYEELIAPLVKAVQVLAAKVEALEAR